MLKRAILISLLLALVVVHTAQAHAADMYFHTHTIALSPGHALITWEMAPGPMVARHIWSTADANADDIVSDAEARTWAQTAAADLNAQLDDRLLSLSVQTVEWPTDIAEFLTGSQTIRIHLSAGWDAAPGKAHRFSLQNLYKPDMSISWFKLAAQDGAAFETPQQEGGRLDVVLHTVGPQAAALLTDWESGRPNAPWVVESLGLDSSAGGSAAPPQSAYNANAVLSDFVKSQESSPGFFLMALAAAVLLGALHALSPGHGKTIVAAYLVGSQGRFYHAAALGGIVTLTHTGSVFALGLLTMAASRYLLTTDIIPVLELASGLLIVALGGWLLTPRLKTWFALRRRQKIETNAPLIVESAANGAQRLVLNQPIKENTPNHSHDPSGPGFIPRGLPASNPLAGISWRSLVTLGVGGGLVPCPDAIALLLIAVTINRILFGLSLIVAFSLGLAVILIVIGLLILQGKRLFSRLQWFDRIAYQASILSAVVVLVIGGLLTVEAAQKVSAAYASGPQAAASFNLQNAAVIYNALDDQKRYQLFAAPAAGGAARQITHEDSGVWDYAVSPEKDRIIYTAESASGATRLWLLSEGAQADMLLECSDVFCSNAVWSPDGKRILYIRRESGSKFNTYGMQTIWWLELNTRQTGPLFQDGQMPGFSPQWSPNAQWLSYTSINPQEIQVYQAAGGARQSLPSQTGHQAVWAPDSRSFLLVDVSEGEFPILQVFRYDLASQTKRLLIDDQTYVESFPAWSPDGSRVALARYPAESETPEFGNQIWLVRPDGSNAYPAASEKDVFYGQPVWSPDGRYLVFDANIVRGEQSVTVIQVLEVETGRIHEVAAPGSRPDWLRQGAAWD